MTTSAVSRTCTDRTGRHGGGREAVRRGDKVGQNEQNGMVMDSTQQECVFEDNREGDGMVMGHMQQQRVLMGHQERIGMLMDRTQQECVLVDQSEQVGGMVGCTQQECVLEGSTEQNGMVMDRMQHKFALVGQDTTGMCAEEVGGVRRCTQQTRMCLGGSEWGTGTAEILKHNVSSGVRKSMSSKMLAGSCLVTVFNALEYSTSHNPAQHTCITLRRESKGAAGENVSAMRMDYAKATKKWCGER